MRPHSNANFAYAGDLTRLVSAVYLKVGIASRQISQARDYILSSLIRRTTVQQATETRRIAHIHPCCYCERWSEQQTTQYLNIPVIQINSRRRRTISISYKRSVRRVGPRASVAIDAYV